ncbi:MAG: lnt [Ilumatobacteraceae bacterium]|nr:lnt [Ilumatobacteraceae bacterium]
MSRPRRPTKKAFVALGAGVPVALSLPPWGLWPLAFVGIIVFETALGEDPSRGTRFRYGWLFAAGWLFPGMVWMWFLTAPGYLLATALFATFHGLAALVAPTGRWRVIGRAAAHTLAEALRFCFPFGGVPLASLAISQSAGPLVGVVRIGGAVLLTWITFQIGIAIAAPSPFVPQYARRLRSGAEGAHHGVVALVVVIAIVVIAAIAPSGTDTGRSLRVAVVQGGGPQGTHAVDVTYCAADGTPAASGPLSGSACVTQRQLEATRTLQPSDDLDVVVWPENVIDVADFAGSLELTEVAAEAKRLHASFLVGVTEDKGENNFTNAQVVVTPDGNYTDRYDKVRRVPFGEYVPLRGLLQALGAPTNLVPRNAIAGTAPAILTIPEGAAPGDTGTKVAVVISWEVFFGGRARDGVSHGGELLINPTNGSSYTWTVLQTQQVASSRLRAIETGRWVAQAAPTGFSAFVSPDGDVYERTSVSEQAVITRALPLRTGNTWYVEIGDKPWVAVVLVVFLVAVLGSGWRPRRLLRSVRSGAGEVTAPTSP